MKKENRKIGAIENAPRKPTENEFPKPAVPISPHDKEVRMEAMRCFKDRIGDRPAGREDKMGGSVQPVPAQLLDDAFRTV